MERFLRKRFLGQKQFSVEGLDVMIPMLDETLELAAESGAHEVVMGMAHRGRLNVLAHTIGMPYEYILREFEGERTIDAVTADPEGGTGDVKYHLAAHGTRTTSNGKVGVRLVANPSHLEAVNPVVEGRTRAEQTDRSTPNGAHDPSVALAVLLHGDAAFAGQGVVAETLNLQDLEGYATGGTLHLITNNQIGFTTDPSEGRSTRYSSDLAKGFDVPIIHVNADDPEAAVAAVRLAMAYRKQFAQDVVIDLVGYRRFGHNEQDEAAYTQPLMVEQINAHPSVRELYQAQLVAEGVLTSEEAEAFVTEVESVLRAAHERLRASIGDAAKREHDGEIPRSTGVEVTTAVAGDRLTRLNEELLAVPEDFTVHPKLARQLERRRVAIDEGGIDWGQAEALAYASLLVDGIPVRLTGQDTQRGTFAQRHLVLHDSVTGETYTPMQHLEGAQASFEVFNSPLSEYACVGFEYGYSAAAPEALVLWEAQYGDFANGAQIVIDQFISSGLSKWRETSRLTLLLPHGYEGNGPEHSSARLERFLQLAAQENIRVANCTTSAQYFHLLRLQALDPTARPLVVVTPKGLLRLKDASSALADLADGSFQPVLDDPGADKEAVRRLVLCSGKVYYDLVGHEAHGSAQVALARVEQLYPFPTQARDGADLLVPAAPRGRVGAGGAAEHGPVALDPPPARGGGGRPSAPLHRPSVAGQPERGLSDRARDRAGPDRPRGARALAAAASGLAAPGGGVLLHEPWPVLPCHRDRPAALTRREPPPELPEHERGRDRADAAGRGSGTGARAHHADLFVVAACLTARLVVAVVLVAAAAVAGIRARGLLCSVSAGSLGAAGAAGGVGAGAVCGRRRCGCRCGCRRGRRRRRGDRNWSRSGRSSGSRRRRSGRCRLIRRAAAGGVRRRARSRAEGRAGWEPRAARAPAVAGRCARPGSAGRSGVWLPAAGGPQEAES